MELNTRWRDGSQTRGLSVLFALLLLGLSCPKTLMAQQEEPPVGSDEQMDHAVPVDAESDVCKFAVETIARGEEMLVTCIIAPDLKIEILRRLASAYLDAAACARIEEEEAHRVELEKCDIRGEPNCDESVHQDHSTSESHVRRAVGVCKKMEELGSVSEPYRAFIERCLGNAHSPDVESEIPDALELKDGEGP